jgi:hypothetical protein
MARPRFASCVIKPQRAFAAVAASLLVCAMSSAEVCCGIKKIKNAVNHACRGNAMLSIYSQKLKASY